MSSLMSTPVYRFAPSPNGELHLGHALSALINYDLARQTGGRFLLRIEDIDVTRCRPEFEQLIYEDLAWLGIEWEKPVRRQSDHFDAYRKAMESLWAKNLLYAGFLTRAEIKARVAAAESLGEEWPLDPDGAPLYPSDEHHMPDASIEEKMIAGMPYAFRLKMDEAIAAAGGGLDWTETGEGPVGETGVIAARPRDWGDVVIARKEIPTSYHLSVVVDDALQGVTHVVRGQDLFHATSVHRLLQRLLGLPEPEYRHHRLINDNDGRKLSKSDQATGLRQLRGQGVSPADIRRIVGLA